MSRPQPIRLHLLRQCFKLVFLPRHAPLYGNSIVPPESSSRKTLPSTLALVPRVHSRLHVGSTKRFLVASEGSIGVRLQVEPSCAAVNGLACVRVRPSSGPVCGTSLASLTARQVCERWREPKPEAEVARRSSSRRESAPQVHAVHRCHRRS